MREIKFRAWDDVEQRFWTLQDGGETSGEGSVQYFGNEQGVLEIGRLEEFDVGLGISSQFTVFPLSQYTGLKDKNGREIFEGDVATGAEDGEAVIDRVIYQGGAFYISANSEHWDDILLSEEHERIEIVGNVYENPESLEVMD